MKHWNLHIEGHIATLVIQRPQALNSLTPDALFELHEISGRLASDEDIWFVVLRGAGDHFSAGVDVSAIQALVGQPAERFRSELRALQRCLDDFEALPQIKIAAIRGHCIGGGLLLACCCDFRIADETARFHLPEVQLGIAVIMGTQRLTRLVGSARAKEMILLAERFEGERAAALGLLTELVQVGELDNAVQNLLDRLLNYPPRTLQIARRIIDEGALLDLRASQELEIALQTPLLYSADFAEALKAFAEKRRGRYTGH